jgi:hypothetical protein
VRPALAVPARAARVAAREPVDHAQVLARAAREAGLARVVRGAPAGSGVQVRTAVRLPADPRGAAPAALRAEGAEAGPAAAARTAPLVQAVPAAGRPAAGTAAPAVTTSADVPNPGPGGGLPPAERPAAPETNRTGAADRPDPAPNHEATGAADQPDPAPNHEAAAVSKALPDPQPVAGRAAKDHGTAQHLRCGPGKGRLLVPGQRPHRGGRRRQVRRTARRRQRGPGRRRVGGSVRIGRPGPGDRRNRGRRMRQGCGLRGRQRRHALGERQGHAPQPARTRGAPPERAGHRPAASAPPATGGRRFRQASLPTSWTPRRERSSERCRGTWPTPWLSGSLPPAWKRTR